MLTTPQDASRLRWIVLLAAAVPVAIIAVLSVLIFWQVRVLTRYNRLVVHNHQVIAQAWLVNKLVVDQETGLRAYLLARDDEFLDPYTSAAVDLPGAIAELRRLVADDAAQSARVDELEARREEWRLHAARMIAVPRPPGAPPTPEDRRLLLALKASMDAMRRT